MIALVDSSVNIRKRLCVDYTSDVIKTEINKDEKKTDLNDFVGHWNLPDMFIPEIKLIILEYSHGLRIGHLFCCFELI